MMRVTHITICLISIALQNIVSTRLTLGASSGGAEYLDVELEENPGLSCDAICVIERVM